MGDAAPGFYGSYASYKEYLTPVLGKKQIQRFDKLIWEPGHCQPNMRFLEVGCGTGEFLSYLAAKGCHEFIGIDHDPALRSIIDENVRGHFVCRDIWEALGDSSTGQFDCIVALDVLEHFSPEESLRLISSFKERLVPQGRMVIKVPNASCPWGLQYQFGDLTHRTAFNPFSMRQLADAAGMDVIALLPHRQGTRRRMITDYLIHRFLSWALLTPPTIWTANFVSILQKP